MIEVEHLSKSYGKGQAVNDISFTVNKGEILGFLGPNGAGKTTTMRVITGFLPATSGTVRVAGFDVAEQSLEVRKRIGYLPETPPIYPEMSVKAYLEFVARIKGVANADLNSRVNAAMEMTNITDRANDLIRKLSRGYKQRVGIAQAVVHNPDVVILDEPTVGLDPKQIIEVRNLIKGLAGEHTIILSTHILPEVSMTCDRVIIINKGKIAAVDTPNNLTSQLKGSERVHLQIGGNQEAVHTALASIEGVTSVEIKSLEFNDDDEEDEEIDMANESIEGVSSVEGVPLREYLSVTVENKSGLDLRSQIAARVISGGFELYELRAVSLSLEDIFLQLTTEEKATTEAKESL